jgi:hypothetical protein
LWSPICLKCVSYTLKESRRVSGVVLSYGAMVIVTRGLLQKGEFGDVKRESGFVGVIWTR